MNTMIIDGRRISFEQEANVLQVIRGAGIDLPTFCYHSELSVYGACRMCIVDVAGRGIQAACHTPAEDGLEIKTNTAKLRRIRKMALELLLANHDRDCTTCDRSGSCKLQDLAQRFGVRDIRFGQRDVKAPIDASSAALVRDPNKCILCGDCVRICREVQGIGVLDFSHRGSKMTVSPAFNKELHDVECVNCGQCAAVCPTGALTVKNEIARAWQAIHDESITVVVQIAPAVRVSLGESFGLESGKSVMGQLSTALKQMGVDKVFDTSFAADLTVMEESSEFLQRFQSGTDLPQFTSCCPAWVKFVEQYHPDILGNLSSCRSPQQMFGSLAKRYYAQELGIPAEKLFVMSIMPCTAKKFEAGREEFQTEGRPDVDVVITTQELGRMIEETGIDFAHLEPTSLDMPFGFATGAGVIFGVTGGVSEAVLRFAHETVTGQELEHVVFQEVRGYEGVKKASFDMAGTTVRIAVVHGLAHAAELLKAVKAGKEAFDFIEVMACPGGCVGGAGQPISAQMTASNQNRGSGLYKEDQLLQMHKAQQNPMVNSFYQKWIEEPGSEAAHLSLHTRYGSRKRIQGEAYELSQQPEASVDVQVCVGTSCYLKGSVELLKNLKYQVGKDEIDEQVKLRAAFCCQQCAEGPMVLVDDTVMNRVGADRLPEVMHEIKDKIAKQRQMLRR